MDKVLKENINVWSQVKKGQFCIGCMEETVGGGASGLLKANL